MDRCYWCLDWQKGLANELSPSPLTHLVDSMWSSICKFHSGWLPMPRKTVVASARLFHTIPVRPSHLRSIITRRKTEPGHGMGHFLQEWKDRVMALQACWNAADAQRHYIVVLDVNRNNANRCNSTGGRKTRLCVTVHGVTFPAYSGIKVTSHGNVRRRETQQVSRRHQ